MVVVVGTGRPVPPRLPRLMGSATSRAAQPCWACMNHHRGSHYRATYPLQNVAACGNQAEAGKAFPPGNLLQTSVLILFIYQ